MTILLGEKPWSNRCLIDINVTIKKKPRSKLVKYHLATSFKKCIWKYVQNLGAFVLDQKCYGCGMWEAQFKNIISTDQYLIITGVKVVTSGCQQWNEQSCRFGRSFYKFNGCDHIVKKQRLVAALFVKYLDPSRISSKANCLLRNELMITDYCTGKKKHTCCIITVWQVIRKVESLS